MCILGLQDPILMHCPHPNHTGEMEKLHMLNSLHLFISLYVCMGACVLACVLEL